MNVLLKKDTWFTCVIENITQFLNLTTRDKMGKKNVMKKLGMGHKNVSVKFAISRLQ